MQFQVATVLTVYGIETMLFNVSPPFTICNVATVLTVYGIETSQKVLVSTSTVLVATVLTVYGIETLLLAQFY